MKIFLVYGFTWLSFFLIGTLCILDFSSGESLEDVYAKECEGTSSGLEHSHATQIDRYRSYEEHYKNCTRVKRNLEIVFLQLTDAQYDFSFLENIREVDGYVLIYGNLVPKIRLTKLRVIRGHELYVERNRAFGLYVAVNSIPDNNSVGLQELQLPSLVEILQGSVMFKGNSRLCFGENTVNWEHILLGGSGKFVNSTVPAYNKINCSSDLRCHENCSVVNGQRFCWGPEADMCQIIHICGGNETRCTKDNRRCHPQCIAGCNREDNATECLSCLKFARGSECVSDCSARVPRTELNGLMGYVTPVNRYSEGSKCVENCSAGFSLHDNKCIRSCKVGYMEKDQKCIRCEGEYKKMCPGTKKHRITKDHLLCFKGCRKVNGNLKIDSESFASISVEDLEWLSDIEVITGKLVIQAQHPNFTSLNFLRNLKAIKGIGIPADENTLEVFGTSLTSLGLKSLRQVKEYVVIVGNNDLCYADTIDWQKMINSSSCGYAVRSNKDSSTCKNQGFVCSPACLTSDGCMGPGDNNCVTCAQFNLIDGSCSINCSIGNGFFIKDGKECRPCDSSCNGSCVDEFVCGECHRECIGCHGLSPTQCHSCRNYRQMNDSTVFECVEKCSKGFYDAGNKQCLPCDPDCSVCRGSKNSECSECNFVRIYRELGSTEKHYLNYTTYKWYCGKTCPKGQSEAKVENQTERTCITIKYPLLRFMESSIAIPVFVVLFLVIFVGLVLLIVILRKQKLRQLREKILAIDEIPMKNSSGVKPDMALLRLIKESELRRANIIGSGAFGTVYKGIWIPDKENVKIPVAIKVLTEKSSTNLNMELLDEARIMASVCHPNCVRILAVCMTAQMMLITQLMPLGCLLDYVRKERSNIGSRALLLWSVQIAKGMEYLEELGIVHRDLAARNVLVCNPNQVKITDFGLAKLLDSEEEEIHSEGEKMPIKWLALECIEHRIYTHKSDVWSYGVTLWEMFTYGKRPYEDLHPLQIPQALEKGERLLQPEVCSIDVYMTLIKCWMLDVDSRPTFSDLVSEFTRMAEDPGRFLVIQGDELLRLPSQTPDAKDLIALISVPLDDPDLMIVSAEDYLRPEKLLFEHNNDYYPSNNSHRSPLASIKENVAYENSELVETRRRTENCISSPCQSHRSKDEDKPSGYSPIYRVDEDGYLPPQPTSIQPRYMDLMFHGTFDNSESDKNPEQGHMDVNVVSGISKDNLTYYDNEDIRLMYAANKTDKLNERRH